jgi:non-ribosomal peptide synthetase component E (peptide arylation enzyme)
LQQAKVFALAIELEKRGDCMTGTVLPWFKEYTILGIPETFKPYPDQPAYDILYKTARMYKNQGLIQMDYMMTYPDVKDHVDRLATALFSMGLKKGDRVATLLPTSIRIMLFQEPVWCIFPAAPWNRPSTFSINSKKGRPML